jgi:hypothetical protein
VLGRLRADVARRSDARLGRLERIQIPCVRLDLRRDTGVGDRGALAIGAATHLGALRYLGLSWEALTPDTAVALSGAPHLADLDYPASGEKVIESKRAERPGS